MFQDDDWDIGDDYLKDFDSSNVVSSIRPREDSNCELPSKKPRLENSTSQSNLIDKSKPYGVGKQYKSQILNVISNEFSNIDQASQSNQGSKTFPKKFGLEKFISQGNSSDQNKSNKLEQRQYKSQILNIIQNKEPKENDNSIQTKSLIKKPETSKLNFSRLSEYLPKKVCKPQEEFREDTIENSNPSTSNQCIKENIKNNNHVPPNKKKTASISFRGNILNDRNSDKGKPPETTTSTNESRKTRKDLKRNVVFDILTSTESRSEKVNNVPKKQTVIRRFPGPAGLLPENINKLSSLSQINLDENETERNDESNMSNICSQNTNILFSEGAWQHMADDLPAHIKLFEISTIKENAEKFSNECKKVPYTAGLIQSINWKPADPVISLKDISGEINACLHHSIPTRYPNVLGRGIVLLLKDIGMIMRNAKSVNIIISSKNLVGIYSATDKIICKGFENVFQNSEPLESSVLNENLENEVIQMIPDVNVLPNRKDNLSRIENTGKCDNVDDDCWDADFDFFTDENILVTSTPAENTNLREKSPNTKSNETSQAKSNHMFVENDEDDELLSQIDMDTLTASCGM